MVKKGKSPKKVKEKASPRKVKSSSSTSAATTTHTAPASDSQATPGGQAASEGDEGQPSKRRDPPPKKTGKRGIGPLNVEEDFDTPTRKEPQEEPQGSSLLVEQPPKPKVVGDRMEIFYEKPIFGKFKEVITVSLVCSIPIEKEHEKLIPKIVRDAYHDISKKGRKSINLKDPDLPGQRAVFYLAPDIKEETLVLPAAKLLHVSLVEVQRKGEGVSRNVIRLSFRLQVKLSREVAHFAEHNLQNNFWITLEDTQEELFDEEED